jgi:DNA-binding response OmpR family regulator
MRREQDRKKQILIVEDDYEIGHLYLDLLVTEANYMVKLANDPSQALNIVEDFKPDLFILDYLLPQMDGLELYKRLHTIKGLEQTPALVITGTLLDKQGQEPGIIRIQKPFDIDILLQTIENISMV